MISIFNFPCSFIFTYFITLFAFKIAATEMTQNINVFSLADCWECWWLWKKASLSSADVQSDVLSPSCMHETTFSIDHSFVDDIL